MRHFQMKTVLKMKIFCAGQSAANKMKFIQLKNQIALIGKDKTSGGIFMKIKEYFKKTSFPQNTQLIIFP